MTVIRDHRVEASLRFREDFNNGEACYRMRGRRLEILPKAEDERPAPEFIDWHNGHVFRP